MAFIPATQANMPVRVIEIIKALIYGEGGSGKTSYALTFPSPYFFLTEDSAKHLPIIGGIQEGKKSRPFKTWEEFVEAVDWWIDSGGGNGKYKTFVLDTIDSLVFLCKEWYCRINGKNDISESGYSGWTRVNNEIQKQLLKISAIPCGLVILCHQKTVEKDNRFGNKESMAVPTVSEGIRTVIMSIVDFVARIDIDHVRSRDRARNLYFYDGVLFQGKERYPMPRVIDAKYTVLREEFAKMVANDGKRVPEKKKPATKPTKQGEAK